MATIYTPRPRTPVRAFRLTEDLLASLQVGRPGDWVTLDENDVPIHLTETELHAVYRAEEPVTIDAAPVLATIVPGREARQRGNVLNGQPGRIFHLLRLLGGTAKTPEFYPWLRRPYMLRNDRGTAVSASLCHLRTAGYVASEKGTDFHGNQWTVTQEGIDAYESIGPRCFTDYGLEIPSMGPSPAERLHTAWQDRHAA